MNKFLNNMLERLVIRKLSYSTTSRYASNTYLVTDNDQKKLSESKQLWAHTINKQLSIIRSPLVLFDDSKIYSYDTINTAYSYIKQIIPYPIIDNLPPLLNLQSPNINFLYD